MASTSSSSTRHRTSAPTASYPRQLSHSSSRTPPTSLPLPSDPMAPSPTPGSSGSRVVEARFHRAVDMVQSFPKSGPVNTTYEEKLMLYSLYKQATEGPVTTTRPKLLDFLGRAKWDAWKAREGLTKQQAQESYVDTLMNILKAFSDRPQAREMLEELRAFPGSASVSGSRTGERVAGGAYAGPSQDYASTTSSHRSLSPPPETATSRRSYHSALHTTSSIPENAQNTSSLEEDLTPRRPIRRQGYVDPNESRRVNVPMSSEEEEDEDDYSDIEDAREGHAEASGSQTVSDVSDNETPMRGTQQRIPRTRPAGPHHPSSSARQQQLHRSQGSYDYTLPPTSSSNQIPTRGPSPYQHPAQYPAPVQTQLPPHLPPIAPDSASRTLPASRQAAGHAQIRRQAELIQQNISASTPELSAIHRTQSATVDRALDSIQTSLAALHERLNLMEQTQAALQASNDPRRNAGSGLRAYISRSPILQFLRLFFVRMLELFRIRRRSAAEGYRRNGLSSLLGRALLSLLLGVRDLSRDAIAIIFLVASITSLRNTRGDWRAVVRAWARILALATGVGVVREGGWLLGNGIQQV